MNALIHLMPLNLMKELLLLKFKLIKSESPLKLMITKELPLKLKPSLLSPTQPKVTLKKMMDSPNIYYLNSPEDSIKPLKRLEP